jgi:hypothetical protein
MGNASDKYLPIWASVYVLLHMLISLTSFVDMHIQ